MADKELPSFIEGVLGKRRANLQKQAAPAGVEIPSDPNLSFMEGLNRRLSQRALQTDQAVDASQSVPIEQRIDDRLLDTAQRSALADRVVAPSPSQRIQARLGDVRGPAGSPALEELKRVSTEALQAPDRSAQIEAIRSIHAPEGRGFSLSDLNPFTGEQALPGGVSRDEVIAGALASVLPGLVGSLFGPEAGAIAGEKGGLPAGQLVAKDFFSRGERERKRKIELLKTRRLLEREEFERGIKEQNLEVAKQKLIADLKKQGLTPSQAARNILQAEGLDQKAKELIAKQKADRLKRKDKKTKFTESQSRSAGFFAEMELAEQQYTSARERGFDPTKISNRVLAAVPGQAISLELISRIGTDEFGRDTRMIKEAMAAEFSFIIATLRRESGAAINKDEYVKRRQTLFPQPGDSFQAQTNKAAKRLRLMAAVKIASGGAADLLPTTKEVQREARKKTERVTKGRKKTRIKSTRELQKEAEALGIKVK